MTGRTKPTSRPYGPGVTVIPSGDGQEPTQGLGLSELEIAVMRGNSHYHGRVRPAPTAAKGKSTS